MRISGMRIGGMNLLLMGGRGKWTPKSVVGLSLWLDAANVVGSDGDAVASWVSREGNGYDFAQATAGKKPLLKKGANGIGGRNVVRFDGVDDSLVCTDSIVDSSAGSVFIVLRMTAPLKNDQDVFSSSDTTKNNVNWMCRARATTSLEMLQRNADIMDNIRGHVTGIADRAYIMTWQSDGSAYLCHLNGSQQVLTLVTGANSGDWLADTPGRNAFGLGTFLRDSESNFYFGDVAEVLMYDSCLTGDNLNLVLAYLAHKYSYYLTVTNAASRLAITTYEASNQPLHPDVYDAGVGNTWNGYRFWMAETPYPGSDSQFENPSIHASNDGIVWVEPAGLVNPIVAKPVGGFNSDCDLTRVGDTLYCLFREVITVEKIYETHSTNGVDWSVPVELLAGVATVNQFLSPAVVYHGGQYLMFTIDTTVSPRMIEYRTAPAITGPWSAQTTCTNDMPEQPFHLDVITDGSTLWALIQAVTTGNLYLGKSIDNGLTWAVGANPSIVVGESSAAWDKNGLYRGSLIKRSYGFDIWYTGNGTAGWAIGFTSLYVKF